MHTCSRSLIDLTVVDGEVLGIDGRTFDRAAYAKFKYGFTPPGVQYGRELAALIAVELFEMAGDQPIVIVSAPYKYLPTASHVIAKALLAELSLLAVLDGREPPTLVPFHKARPGSNSYAQSSEADRRKSLETLGLSIDERRITGSHVLVVDDIRITGSAQRSTAQYLESLDPASVWYLHAARLDEATGTAFPALEDELNQSVYHGLTELSEMIERDEFELCTRVLRHILESDPDDFLVFMQRAPHRMLVDMHRAAVGSGPKYYQKYEANLSELLMWILHVENCEAEDASL